MQSDLDRQKRSHTQKKHTSAGSFTSALAESTISFNTLATGLSGITGDGIRLSQFPPPPDAVPTPESANFPSPIGTGSSIAALNAALAAARSHQSSLRGSPRSIPPSPGPAPPAPHPPSSFYPFPSPYGDQFPETSLISPPPMARRPSRSGDVQVMPTDWHDGSSSIDVQPYEARMLSTNVITGLLSSADSAISSGSEIMSPDPVQRKATRYTSVSQFSEMTYPPPPPPRFPPHLSSQLDQIHDMLVSTDDLYHTPSPHTDNDTIASFDGFAEVVRHAGVSRKVSVVGMAPARVTQFSSETAPSLMAQSLRESVTTYDSSHPLQQSLIIPRTTEELEASPVPSYSRRNQTPPSASRTARARRTSTTSNKSMKSQVSSLLYAAGESAARMARSTTDWLRSKPLPPVPIVRNMTLQEEQQHKQRDLAQPLPNLAQRADRLNTMLGQGRLPANSMYSGDMLGGESYEKIDAHDGDVRASGVGLHSGGRKRTSVGGATAFAQHGVDAGGAGGPSHPPQSRPGRIKWPGTRKAKIKLALVVGVAVVIVAVAIGIGIGVSHAHNQHNCSGNMTGAACTLDATCVCAQQSGQSGCTPVAASLINLVPTVNKNFNTNFSSSDVAASVLAAFGSTTDCFAQARVVDVATALDESIVPNRTTWAQSALMWSFVQSQSTSSVAKLQSFVRGANWASVQNIDGPIPSASSRFSTTTMGFTFDFAGQTITEPSILFATDGQASKDQLSRVDQTTTSALNKVYSAASAMSTLYSTAIQTYWTSILKRNAKDYPTFVSLLIGSPVLLPFNATDIPIATLLASATSSSSFPPPASCYPGLPSTVLEQLSAVETEVFGLSSPGPQTAFDPACFPDQPIYGVLDYLRLRLPFPDSSSNSPVQAAVLAADVRPRVVIANGPQFSAFASSSSRTPTQLDVLQYGTMTHLNHVIMNFFAAIPSADLANALVDYVLSQSSIPPDSSSPLVQNIASLPVLEAAVLGTVLPSDVDAVYSSFATPSGALFFGTDGSLATRKWAINVTNSFVAWTESATASQVVHDNSFTDSTFNSVWDPAFQFFHSSTGSVVNVGNITGAFQAVHKFSSS